MCVFPADCTKLHKNIGLWADARHFTVSLDRGVNHACVVTEFGLGQMVASMTMALLEAGSALFLNPDLGFGMGPLDPETGRRLRKRAGERAPVVAPTRAHTNVVAWLINKHPMLPVVHGDALVYHSGLTEAEKEASLAAWRRGHTADAGGNQIPICFLVATSSLMEGSDENNVTWVTVPLPHGDVKNTAQEMGRAGAHGSNKGDLHAEIFDWRLQSLCHARCWGPGRPRTGQCRGP